ncbi:hypothetical protein [Agrobacterium tumefaciens]|uniref:hypothetical protein n=1 Tax=Agrobacterium tumefaciens TaxID=358 RepID=UPI002AFFF724|nr:hypothetical protein [Agrobacterium tumefaciens]MEA1843054.1 hypothetical protein [Agrobacterium tumefaciens]
MFNKNLAHDVAIKRLNDIHNRCFNSGYYLYQVAKIENGDVLDSWSSTFQSAPGHSTFRDRLVLETRPVKDFFDRFGLDGNGTLFVFDGGNVMNPSDVWRDVSNMVEYEAIDVGVLESEHGIFDATKREHMYLVGFPNTAQRNLFLAGFAGQDLGNKVPV